LLKPKETKTDGGQGKFKRARSLDMLAGKIVRCMTDKYKATDIIDIYNLCHSSFQDSGKPFVNIDPQSPENHLDVLRVLIASFMPMSRGVYPSRDNLLSVFADTPERKKKFLTDIEGQIAAHKIGAIRESVDEIFKGVNDALGIIMCRKPRGAHGVLNLTDGELAFVNEIVGWKEDTVVIKPEAPPIRIGRITIRKRRDAIEEATRERIEPAINVTHLQKEYPEVFKKYPELADNIKRNPILCDTVSVAKYGTSPAVGDSPGDF
jgi:hypothetical protein